MMIWICFAAIIIIQWCVIFWLVNRLNKLELDSQTSLLWVKHFREMKKEFGAKILSLTK